MPVGEQATHQSARRHDDTRKNHPFVGDQNAIGDAATANIAPSLANLGRFCCQFWSVFLTLSALDAFSSSLFLWNLFTANGLNQRRQMKENVNG